jgi:glycosyltransferase involved in cell wall biosynthesis
MADVHRKPKVLMLLANPFQPDPRVLNEARSLSRICDVTVWALDGEGRYPRHEEVEGIHIGRVRLAGLSFLRSVLQKLQITLLAKLPFFYLITFRWISKDFSVVHSHDLATLPLGVILGKLKHVKVVYDAHEDFPAMVGFKKGRVIWGFLLWLERLLMRRVAAVLVVGEIMRQEYSQRTNKPVYVVGNWKYPVNFQGQSGLIHPQAIDAHAQGKLIVSYLAGINATRLIQPLLEAAKDDSEVFVIIAGGRANDAMASQIERAVAELPNGLYLGWLDQERLNAYFAFTDVLYYCLLMEAPNNQYSASNTIFSALAAGKAIITTDIGEGGRIVKEQQCGIVMPQATKEEVLAALAQFKDRDHLKMLQYSASKAAQFYSWRRAEETLLALYQKLLASGS